MALVSKKRHLLKTLTWRVIASTDTLLIGWFLTGSWKIGSSIACIEIVTKMLLYYFHERLWYRTKFLIKKTNNKQKTKL